MGTLTALFITISLQTGLKPGLLSSLCYVESKHKVTAIAYNDGKTHSYGVCQIKITSAQQMGFKGSEKDLMKPENNIKYAALFLKYQINRYDGNIARGVTAYNKGRSTGDGNSVYYKKVMNQWRNECQTIAKM